MDAITFHATSDVEQAARHRLRGSPYFALRELSCDFVNGSLCLRGRLPSFYYKQLAQETVSGMDGVSQIVNDTEVLA